MDWLSGSDGVVTHIEPEWGEALVQDGDVVARGDILISGTVTMPPPLYSELPPRYYQTHARGRIWARTWRVLTAVIPVEAAVKEYTGSEKSVWSLNVLGQRVKIFGTTSISWPMYDKITTVRQAALPGGDALPLALNREVFREYQLQTVEVDLAAAQALLEEQLLQRLDLLTGEDGEVESTQFTARMNGGCLEVTLTAQCLEEIGQERPGEHPLESD